MTLLLEFPDSCKQLLGLDKGDAAERTREMLIQESDLVGRLSGLHAPPSAHVVNHSKSDT
jgi:hypothetical protein